MAVIESPIGWREAREGEALRNDVRPPPSDREMERSSRRLHAKRLVAFFWVAKSQGAWEGWTWLFLASNGQ